MAEMLAIPGMLLGAGGGTAAAMPMLDPITAPALIGGSTAAQAASSAPKTAEILAGIDTGTRLGELAGMGQQQQPQGIVQAPPDSIPKPLQQMPSGGGFTPSALGILQEFLRSRQGY